MKILLVEDQEATLEILIYVITKVFISKYSKHVSIDVAKWYQVAEELININQYDLILLDHRMPYEDPKCTDEDGHIYYDKLKNIGYGLIKNVRKISPNTKIIGTSSLNKEELSKHNGLDFTISKQYSDAENELNKVAQELFN